MHRNAFRLAGLVLAGFAFSGLACAQEDTGYPGAAANSASTYQDGGGNAAGIAQTGSGNTAGIRQFGRNNTGTITQAGSGNSACLVQAGRNLNGSIQQAGSNQTSGLLQTRWGSSEIPVEVCATATERIDVLAYDLNRPLLKAQKRARARGRAEP